VRNQPHKPTSADIATLAGVSRSTVSRVINGYQNVPEDTRSRVMAVIEQQGYYPSLSGQTLRGKRARCVGVILGEPDWGSTAQAAMLYAFSQSAQALGYKTLTGRAGAMGTPESDRGVREVLFSGCVDAGVFLDARGGATLIRQLLREGLTIGALGCAPETGDGRLYTVGLNHAVAVQAAAFARVLGHRRVALVCDPCSHVDAHAVCARFQQAAAGPAMRVLWPETAARQTVEMQVAAALDALQCPLLLVCADLPAVFAAYRAAYARGLTVGADVSILGMGLLPPDLPLWPPLSGFRFDPREMVGSLAARLIRGLEGAADAPRHSEIQHCPLEGASCGPCA
jgi:LacI family transcriptional regulator